MFYWWRQHRNLKHNPVEFIRQEFAFWGFPIVNMTDEQIEQGIMGMSKAFASCSITTQQFIDAWQTLSRPREQKR